MDQLPFFSQFSPELRDALKESGDVQTFHEGEEIFSVENTETDFYLLVGGRIRNYKISEGGQKRILRTVQPGDTFALLSLFDERPMKVSSEVLGEQAKVFIIPRERFHELLKQYYELARFVIDGLVRRIRKYGNAMTSMTVYTTDQRFIAYLFELLDIQGEDAKQVILPDSVKTIAEQLGTVREVLSREISKLSKKGWIKKEGQKILLLDKKALHAKMEE